MKFCAISTIYTANKFHNFCLELYKEEITAMCLKKLFALDFFINRLVMYFLDTIMLFITDEEEMEMVKECFTFNWTATHFFNQIEKDFITENDRRRLTCGVPFIYERNKRTKAFYNVTYYEWHLAAKNIPYNLKKRSIEMLFNRYNLRKIYLPTTDCMKYKDLVHSEFKMKQFHSKNTTNLYLSLVQPEVPESLKRTSVICGPDRKPLTMQEVENLRRKRIYEDEENKKIKSIKNTQEDNSLNKEDNFDKHINPMVIIHNKKFVENINA
ncbi:hypothetical protein EHP00_1279 [Ecytonucleospora hepatopenaei]|uniref:Uncharacterized protein n=1 Tax=Ecytonucleospora hepatopenaei TaxID=646526 RepID=A0A1W0E684_9MICR|nr:hypothetical protein EHP00_1279 [Ecytonucleospora hepatopenaei]